MKKIFSLLVVMLLAFGGVQAQQHLKKDGTPDKRFKTNQHLKKDGTPDMRYNSSKPGSTTKATAKTVKKTTKKS